MKTYSNFTSAYVDLLKTVYLTPEHIASPRGLKIKEKLGHSFRISDIRDRIPYVPHRDLSISYLIAELVWYLSANNSTEWISNYSAFWKNISDDGVTANSAYGARIFNSHPYQKSSLTSENFELWTQWSYVKEELKNDPDSRRAVIHIRMPQDSMLAKKDVPCTLSLQFFIRDDSLHQVVSMRSSDLILGLAYDVPAFTIFQELLALELGVECGSYTHVSNSLHIYERHFEMVEKILLNPWVAEFPHRCKPMPKMPSPPPLDFINANEQKFRISYDASQLLSNVESVKNSSIEQYWKEWLYILAWHRAGKLDLEHVQQQILKHVSFTGYKLFNK